MRVVILAGGMGTRLSEYTKTTPKPMVKINNSPIILCIMKHYARFGFKDFLIAVGYKKVSCNGWVVEAFLGYHYWSAPNYFTSEFKTWVEDDNNTFSSDNNLSGELYDLENGLNSVWFWTYGFPVDLQFKIGKIIGW